MTHQATDYTRGNINTENHIRVNRSNHSYDRNLIPRRRLSISKEGNSSLLLLSNKHSNSNLRKILNTNLNGSLDNNSFNRLWSKDNLLQSGSSTIVTGPSTLRNSYDSSYGVVGQNYNRFSASSCKVKRTVRTKGVRRKSQPSYTNHRSNGNHLKKEGDDSDKQSNLKLKNKRTIHSVPSRRSFESNKSFKILGTRSSTDGVGDSFFVKDFVPTYTAKNHSKSYEF